MAVDSQEGKPPSRIGLYVDGFNLYHAVSDLDEPFLKWCNLWRLGECIISPKSQQLVRVAFCTAFYPKDSQRKFRHQRYIDALGLAGVDTVLGHYVYEDMDCHDCGHEWAKPTEKESDINLSLSLYDDAMMDIIDEAWLLTADSDQAATARMFANRFPSKKLCSVSPPGRGHSAHILKYTNHHIALTKEHIERSLFRYSVTNKENSKTVLRPNEYTPPGNYVHWDDRPKKR